MKNISKWPDGLKKTKQREEVLYILKKADRPISALDIHLSLTSGGSKVWLSTVYRILETFEQLNIVVKAAVLDNETTLYELNSHEHKHYAVCLSCHNVSPICDCPLESLSDKIEVENFQVTGHKLEIYGYCKDCSKKATSSNK